MLHKIYDDVIERRMSWSYLNSISEALTCGNREADGTHVQSDHMCSPEIGALEHLPFTEYDRAEQLSDMLGDELIYLDGWKMWDGTEYLACGEEWPRKAVTRYAALLGTIERAVDNLYELARQSAKDRDEEVDEYLTHLKDGYKRMMKEVKSDRGIKNIASLMQVTSHPPRRDAGGLGMSLAEFMAVPQTVPLVEGLLPGVGIGQMYGESYIGKTFAAVDLACSVASGRDTWLGQTINNPGRGVLYVAAEGGDPIRKMFQGWKAGHPGLEPDARIRLRDAASGHGFSLTDASVYGVEDLKRDYEAYGSPALIVIDPQADVTQGIDENSKALADALRPLQKFAHEVGCFVLLVHHTGKDASKGARGSSAQRAMMDVQIEFGKGSGKDTRLMTFQKVKGEELPDKPYQLEFRTSNGLPYLHCAGTALSPQEEAEARTFLIDAQVLKSVATEAKSARSISEELKISRAVVTDSVKRLDSESKITNTGSQSHPKWLASVG
ncbi:hypothetical protein BMR85_028390 [Achromobacter sp. KAs 3-5]|nr:hypothetical protein BMR85_028390 [Achromobacter sp. KAs 3-5]